MKNLLLKTIFYTTFAFIFCLPFSLNAEEASSTPLIEEGLEVITENISSVLNLRYNDSLVFSGSVNLTKGDLVTVTDSLGEIHQIPSNSVLALLIKADEGSDGFLVDDLDYYSSYDSFIVNCIDVGIDESACMNWQYVVDGKYPFVGIDDYLLDDGEVVFLYFGSPRRFSVSTTTVSVNETFTAHVEFYDYENNIWNPLSLAIVGATKPNPNDPFSPLIPFSATTNEGGDASFSITEAGDYGIGLALDYYFPTKPITVLVLPNEEIVPNESQNESSGNGSSSHEDIFDISGALDFLASKENGTGVIGNELINDWSAIAFAGDSGYKDLKTRVKDQMIKNIISGDWLPDYERRAMALMALGVSPYKGTGFDYISYIVSQFDGTQFGEKDIFNDDIFAIIPLLNAGFSSSDEIIKKTTEFILSRQSVDGSWVGVDLTAAAIQALSLVDDLPGVDNALQTARDYLKSSQGDDGGWHDVFATSWVMQAVLALGESPKDWIKGENNPEKYLLSHQGQSGEIITNLGDDSDMWATAYAVLAIKGKTWDEVMKNFSRPSSAPNNQDSVSRPRNFEAEPIVLGAYISNEAVDRELILWYIELVTGLSRDTIIYVG